MDTTKFQASLLAAGFPQLAQAIDKIARLSLRLHATAAQEADLLPGTSKLGGLPDLPAGWQWPQWKGLPQSFIAQIRLADVQRFRQEGIGGSLPEQGMLWFFYDAHQETYGDQPEDRGGWSILFLEDEQVELQRRQAAPGLPAAALFQACALRFTPELTCSEQPALDISSLLWNTEDQQRYDAVIAGLETTAERAVPHHRLLGFPDTLQDDMRSQCQLVSHGVTDEDDPRQEELLKGALDWRLLLQVDSDPQAGMRWANNGLLYYWMNQADRAAPHVDASWLVLQSE